MSRHPKPPEGLPLAPALSFLQHLWAFNHALERLSGDMLSRIGVTAQQRLILRCIATYPELRAGQLASLLHVDPGTISAALKRLEEKKLIERQREADDQRRVSLRLTKSGKMLLRSTKGTVEHAVEGLLAEADGEDLRATVRTLQHLTVKIHAEFKKD